MQSADPETVKLPAKNFGATLVPSIVKAVALYPVAPLVFKKVNVIDSLVLSNELNVTVEDPRKLSVQFAVAAVV